MDYDKKIFQKNVRFLRRKSGLSQEKFGELIGVSQHLVSVYEKANDPNPTLDNLISLSIYANTSIEALLTLNLEEDVFNFGTRKPDAGDFEYSHFESMTYHVYYLKERSSHKFYHGFISFDKKYDKEHLFLHGTATTGHTYDCKMVIEGTNTFYIYGTEIDMPRRIHIGMYYPDFREEVKYTGGLGILTRIDSRKYFVGMKVAVTINELDFNSIDVRERLTQFLSQGGERGHLFINRDHDDEFRNWVKEINGGYI